MNALHLMGDSILDNGIYTETGVSTMDMVAERLPDWEIRRHALDGATITSTGKQKHPPAGL